MLTLGPRIRCLLLAVLGVARPWPAAQRRRARRQRRRRPDAVERRRRHATRGQVRTLLRALVQTEPMKGRTPAVLQAYQDGSDGSTPPASTPVIVVMGNAVVGQRPHDPLGLRRATPGDFGAFVGFLAVSCAVRSRGYEIWNEPDETALLGRRRDVGTLRRAAQGRLPAIKAADPAPRSLTGAAHRQQLQLPRRALRHRRQRLLRRRRRPHRHRLPRRRRPTSSTARAATSRRFSFLGFRTVHDVMAAHGDGAKPIWMTELGWTTTTKTCSRGVWAGKKAAGVRRGPQAAYLKEAYHCLAGYPYVQVALWFNLQGPTTGQTDELNHYGLLRADGSQKPSWDAFHDVATSGRPAHRAVRRLRPPVDRRRARRPTGEQLRRALFMQASATDADTARTHHLPRRRQEDPRLQRRDVGRGKSVSKLDGTARSNLSYGPHTISVSRVGPAGQHSSTGRARSRTSRRRGDAQVAQSSSARSRCAARACKAVGSPAACSSRAQRRPGGRVRVMLAAEAHGKWKHAATAGLEERPTSRSRVTQHLKAPASGA